MNIFKQRWLLYFIYFIFVVGNILFEYVETQENTKKIQFIYNSVVISLFVVVFIWKLSFYKNYNYPNLKKSIKTAQYTP
jgi:hypothetical protein